MHVAQNVMTLLLLLVSGDKQFDSLTNETTMRPVFSFISERSKLSNCHEIGELHCRCNRIEKSVCCVFRSVLALRRYGNQSMFELSNILKLFEVQSDCFW